MTRKFFLVLVLAVFMFSFASAELTFDNVKDYDPLTKTVTISNSFGLGQDYAEIQLLSDLNEEVGLGYVKVAEFRIKGFTDYSDWFKGMEFYNLNKNWESEEVAYDFRMKVDYEETVNKMITECDDRPDGSVSCTTRKDGTYEVQKVRWDKITPADIRENEEMIIGIFTNTKEGDYKEWIPEFYGVKINEWAAWSASLNTDLLRYYDCNASTELISGTYNLEGHAGVIPVFNTTNALIGKSCQFRSTTIKIPSSSDVDLSQNPSSMNFWYYSTNEAVDPYVMVADGGTPQIQLYNGAGEIYIGQFTTNPYNPNTVGDGTWHMITFVHNGSGMNIFIDGTLGYTEAINALVTEEFYVWGGNTNTAAQNVTGQGDEMGWWGRELTPTEVTQLWNGGAGITYKAAFGSVPVLLSPADNYFSDTTSLTFVANLTENAPINVSLIINGAYNDTNTSGVLGNYTWDLELGEENWNWTVEGCTATECSNATTRDFSVDFTEPFINISSPTITEDLIESGEIVQLNFTVEDALENLEDCWWNYNGTNYSSSCTNGVIETNYILIESGNYDVTVWANDSAGNLNYSTRTFEPLLFLEYEDFPPTALEGTSQTISVGIVSNGTTITIANLTYDGVGYLGTIYKNGNNYTINRTLTAASVEEEGNVSFYWNLTVGKNVILDTHNQTITNLKIDNCTNNSILIYNFSIKDEKTQEVIPAASNTTGKVDFSLHSPEDFSIIQSFSTSYETNYFPICMNESIIGNQFYFGSLELEYGADGYATEFYNLQKTTISNTTIGQNVSLYDLDNTSSSTFEITYRDSAFLPVTNALVSIQRKYIDEGVFKLVESPITDSSGKALAHLEEEDAIYNFVFSQNGTILATFTDQRVKCENVLIGTCKETFNSFATTVTPRDYSIIDDVSYYLTYENSTKTVTANFNIETGVAAVMSLNVTLVNASSVELCSNSLAGISGSVSCTVPAQYRSGHALVRFYKSGDFIGQAIISLAEESNKGIYGNNLVFLSIFMFLTLIGVGVAGNPIVTGVFLFIGAILGVLMNITASTGFIGAGATILWLFIAIILIVTKGGNRA